MRSPKAEHGDQIPRLLTTREAAALLGVAPGTLKFWRVKGHRAGPAFVRVGARSASAAGRSRLVRYSLAEIRRYIAERTVRLEGDRES